MDWIFQHNPRAKLLGISKVLGTFIPKSEEQTNRKTSGKTVFQSFFAVIVAMCQKSVTFGALSDMQ